MRGEMSTLRAARSGCCAWHLGPLPRLTAGIGMEPEAASRSQVLFYLSESASDLSGRTPHKDPSLKACLHLLSFSVTLLSAKDENESPGSSAPHVGPLSWTLLRVISACSYFFHDFANERVSATQDGANKHLRHFFFFNPYTFHSSPNLLSVL